MQIYRLLSEYTQPRSHLIRQVLCFRLVENAGAKSLPAGLQVRSAGELVENWSDWAGSVTVKVERDDNDLLITTLTGTFDQAALQGFLRKLYSLGLPLISVNLMDVK